MTPSVLLALALGLVLLIVGAELLVRGASRMATRFGVSPLVIGLTVVAYGTSAPEMAVSVKGAVAGQSGLAFGNVIGSNIFNVLFILGACALITPLVVSATLIRKDVPIMLGAALLAYLLGADGRIGRGDGILLFSLAIFYTLWVIQESRREVAAVKEEFVGRFDEDGDARTIERPKLPRQILLVLAGLALLVVGADRLVFGATSIAKHFGLSDLVIGLTIVAAGTSLPEVATSIMASIRGEREIAVGNVVGSNIFNVLAVLGLSAAVAPSGIEVPPAASNFDVPVMLAVSIACLPIFFTGRRINRWEGALFLGYYVAYTAYLLLKSQQHDALPAFSLIMADFVLPLTGVTLAVVVWRSLKRPVEAAAPPSA